MRHNANKHSKRAWAAILLVFTVQTALANPVGPSVVNGQASFATAGNTLTVTNTPGAIINWQGFSIGANEITRFAQQNASSAVLNRVISSNPSSILGSLQSNGRVFLVNPSGIVFGQGATVDVAGLVATSLNLSNADFLAGRYNFTDMPGAQSVSNAGNLAAQGDGLHGGQIYLIAPDVENTGIITAPNGEILLAAGHSVDLVNSIEPNLRVSITAPAGDATNIGQLIAESGSLGLFGTVVRNSGTASADSATTQGGKIVFKASQRAEISGTATATGTTGGTVQILGNQVGVTGILDASGSNGGGTVLVGGDYQGKNPEVQNATVTYFGADASIKADATQNGNGGKVIVWADDATRAHGSISARGGENGGDGGLVEGSGKQHLSMTGYVDLRASHGRAGMLLLDPGTVNIVVGANGAQSLPDTFTDGYINNQLTLANLTIATSAASGANGAAEDIVFVGSPFIQFDQLGGFTLTLTAGRNITLAGTIGEGVAAGSLFLNIGQSGAGGTLGGAATFNNVATTVVGGAGNDTFDMSGLSSNSSFSINGFMGTDTLMVSDNAATITLADGSFNGTNSITLSNIENAVISGGAANNAISVGGFTGSVAIKATTGTDTITGNGANTTLVGDNIANSWIITAANSGSLNASTSFSGVGTLTGGSGTDTLTGLAAGDTYSITGANAVTLTAGAMSATSIDSLIGGAGADSFNGVSGNLSGDIADGGGATTLIGSIQTGGAQTYSGAVSAAAAVSLTSGGAISATNVANDFTNTVAATGNGIQITDANALTITLNDSGSSTINAGGNLVVSGSVTGTLNTTTTGTGTTSFGATNAGTLISNSAGAIIVNGNITGGGMISLTSTGGSVTQPGGTLGGTSVYAQGTRVNLTGANPTGVIAGRATGNSTGDIFSYTSINGIMVTTVNGFAGIQTASPPDAVSVVLNAGSAGIFQDVTGVIHAGAGTHGLSLITTGPVGLLEANSVGALTATGVGALGFNNAGALTVGIGGNGVTTSGGGPVSITAGSDLTVQAPISAGSGSVSLNAANIYLGSAAATTVSGGAVHLYASQSSTGTVAQYAGGTVSAADGLFINADNISFNGAMLGASGGNGSVSIAPVTVGRPIEIAGAGANAAALSITQANLAAINPAASGITLGGFVIGDPDSGAVTFKGDFTSPGGMYANLRGATVSQDAGTTINGGLDIMASGAITLIEPSNQITSLGGNFTSPSSIDVVTAVPMLNLWGTAVSAGAVLNVKNTGGSILVDTDVTAPTILLQGANGITLGTASSLAASGVATIVLNAGTGGFVNNSSAGALALSAPLSRWLVYAASPAGVVKGGLTSDFRHYNGDYTSYSPASVTETGNGFIYASIPGVLNVDTTLVSGTASHIYGATPTAQFGYAIGNPTIADNEDLLLIAGTPAFNPTPSSITPAGSYTVTYLSGLTSSAGYTLIPGTGLLYVIDPATLALITASLTGTASKTYDGTNTAPLAPGNFLLSGFVNGDDAIVTKTNGVYENSNVGSGILVSTTLAATDFTPVGSTNLANYTLPTSASGPIGNITPAPLTVAANPDSKVYNGTAYSGGNGVSYSGLMNGETAAVLGGTLAYGGTSQGAVNAGSYLITPSGLTSSNYTIGYVDGMLTITPAALDLMSVTANDASKTYGDTLTFTGTEFTPAGLLGGDTISGVTLTSPGAADTANAGIYAITPSNAVFSVGNAGNYTISYVNGQLTVNPAPLTVTADALSKAAGNPDPLLTYTTTGLKLADTTATTLSGELARLAGETAGAYPINQGTLSLLSSNYTMSYVPADFSIISAPSTVVNELVNDIVVAPPDVPFEPPASPEPAAADADDEENKDDEAAVVPDGTPANETATAAAPLPVCK